VTLRLRLTLAFVLVVMVPLIIGAALVAGSFPAALEQRQQTAVSASSHLVSQVVRDACDRARAAADAAGRSATLPPAEAQAALESLLRRGLADGLRVLDKTGRQVVAVGTLPEAPTDCTTTASSDRFVSATLQLSTATGQPAGTAVAAFDARGSLMARLGAAVGEQTVALLTRSGSVLGSTSPLPAEALTDALRHPQGVRSGGFVAAGVPASPGQPFAVVVAQPTGAGPGLLGTTAAVVVVSLLGAVVIAVLSARATTRPLEELGEAAARVASGDLSRPIEVRSRDEIGRLATAFNAMTADLRTYVGQLEASRDELQNGLARLGDTLSSTHDLDRILHVVLESAMASTRASGGMVLLMAPGREHLVLAAAEGVDVPLDLRLTVGHGITGGVARSGDPVRGRVGHGPGELWPAAGEPTGTSCIAVPLKSSGQVIGVLDLFGSEVPGGFDDRDLATIRAFASQATVAVENVRVHEEAQRLSITDGLTGLWNYRYFTMTITKEIERTQRFGRPMALIILDLDHFKAVNDSYGHQRGDAVLIEVAARVRAEARDVDTVARYGGEEIVLVLPETDHAGAEQLAERICAAVRRKPFGEPGLPAIHLTVSAGVAVHPAHGTTASNLLKNADQALYAAKHAGRDTYRVASVTTA